MRFDANCTLLHTRVYSISQSTVSQYMSWVLSVTARARLPNVAQTQATRTRKRLDCGSLLCVIRDNSQHVATPKRVASFSASSDPSNVYIQSHTCVYKTCVCCQSELHKALCELLTRLSLETLLNTLHYSFATCKFLFKPKPNRAERQKRWKPKGGIFNFHGKFCEISRKSRKFSVYFQSVEVAVKMSHDISKVSADNKCRKRVLRKRQS